MSYYQQQIKHYPFLRYEEHQNDFLSNSKTWYPEKPQVLAHSIGSGKAEESIFHLMRFFSENKNATCIYIPSSTRDLRDNIEDRLNKFNKTYPLNFSYSVVSNYDELKSAIDNKINLIISLPMTISNNIDLFDSINISWLVMDEAHEWYFASTVQNIIKSIQPKYQLLLTGTPFVFNARRDDFDIHYFSLNDLRKIGMVSNFKVEIITSTYKRSKEDYSSYYSNIKTNIKYDYDTDRKALYKVCLEMIKKLKMPNALKDMHLINRASKNVLSVFGTLDKTIIYCDAVKQAKHFYTILNEYKELTGKVAISTSQDDIDSEVMNEFKYNTDLKILILCDRGRKGFNMPELFNVVDFTFTFNAHVQFQMFRNTRPSILQPNKQKIFFKVASINNADWVQAFMTGVLSLTQNDYFETFTGNTAELPIPTEKSTPKDRSPKQSKSKRQTGLSAPKLPSNLPLDLDFWTTVLHKRNDAFSTIAFTTLDEVRAHIMGGFVKSKWTKEECAEAASQCSTKKEFSNKFSRQYQYAFRYGWLNEICSHMTTRTYWTDELLIQEAAKYSSVSEFRENSGSAANCARERGKDFYDKITAHMTRKSIKRTKEECQQIASKYSVLRDFIKENDKIYSYIRKNKWENELLGHMKTRAKSYTKKEILEAIKQCKTRSEFLEKYSSMHSYAKYRGWLKNMIKSLPKHASHLELNFTKQQCIDEAKKYQYMTHFKKQSFKYYYCALRNNWVKDIEKLFTAKKPGRGGSKLTLKVAAKRK